MALSQALSQCLYGAIVLMASVLVCLECRAFQDDTSVLNTYLSQARENIMDVHVVTKSSFDILCKYSKMERPDQDSELSTCEGYAEAMLATHSRAYNLPEFRKIALLDNGDTRQNIEVIFNTVHISLSHFKFVIANISTMEQASMCFSTTGDENCPERQCWNNSDQTDKFLCELRRLTARINNTLAVFAAAMDNLSPRPSFGAGTVTELTQGEHPVTVTHRLQYSFSALHQLGKQMEHFQYAVKMIQNLAR